jgi:hypothetical protein
MSQAAAHHYFLRYREVAPTTSEVSAVAAYVLGKYFKRKLSVSKLRKLDTMDGAWTDAQGGSHQFNFGFADLVSHVRQRRDLDTVLFHLPPLLCEWLDIVTMFGKPDAPILRSDGKAFATFVLTTPFGPAFPFSPTIDREGAAYPSLQGPLLAGVARSHRNVVDASDRATAWDLIDALRALLNDCVSLVDVTLHQLYFLAQYRGHDFGWRFDPDALGPRHGQRLKDKLNWIAKITGRPLDDARDEVASFTVLKDLRNHLTHFDPPCFAYSMEDIAGWLNRVSAVGSLLWKIREKMGAQLTSSLIGIILLPPVDFVPTHPDMPRIPQPRDVGYGSTRW